MSFYGNSYHYTAESFARVVLQNSGIKNYLTCPDESDIFKIVPEKEKIYLDARQRESGLGIQSGNHWITLAQSGDTFQIWHNEPGPSDNDRLIISTSKDNNPPIGAISEENNLDFDDVLKVATIFYDPAGHITSPGPAQYYKMPTNPVKPLEIRMNKIDGLDSQGQVDEPEGGSLQKQLRNEMQTISDTMNAMADETDENSLISKLKKMESDFNEALRNFTITKTTVDKMEKDIYMGDPMTGQTSILQRLYNLEN